MSVRNGAPSPGTAVVLAGGFDQIDLIDGLRRRGWRVALIDYHDNPPAASHANVHHRCSTLDIDAVRAIVREERASLLTTACTDQALLCAAQICDELGLPSPLDAAAARRLTNKRWMKEVLLNADIPTAAAAVLRTLPLSLPAGLRFPVVCKPVDSNSSKGVTLARNAAQLQQAFASALSASRSAEVICENYIEGSELSIDAFVVAGQAHVLMVSESLKLANAAAAFPIHRSVQPVAAACAQSSRIEEMVARLASAFGIDNSPMIVQAILGPGGLHVLELSARIAGGAKHRYIKAATGYDVMEAYIDTLFGKQAPTPPRCFPAPPASPLLAMQYLYAQPGVFAALEGCAELKAEGVIVDYFPTKTAGMEIGSALNSSNRVAGILVGSKDQKGLQEALHQLFARIRVLDPQGRDMLLRPQ